MTARVTRYECLSDIPSSGRSAFDACSESSPFLSLEWFENLVRTGGLAPGGVLAYCRESDDGSFAALPLYRPPRNGRLAPRRIGSLVNYYSCRFAPIVSRSTELDAAIPDLVKGVWNDRRSWDVLSIRPVLRESRDFEILAQSFRDVGAVVQPYFCHGNWYLETEGRTYSEYLKSLPKVLRKNIPYMTRKLNREADVRYELFTSTEDDLSRAVSDYENVYNASWKDAEPHTDFIDGLVRLSAEKRWLRLGILYVDDEPAAAQIWLVHGDTASIYKVAYKESFARASVGTILSGKVMEQVIDVDGVRVVDYLTGDDDYKKNWMSHRRELWGHMVFNTTSVKGRISMVRHVYGARLKSLWRRLARSNASSCLG